VYEPIHLRTALIGFLYRGSARALATSLYQALVTDNVNGTFVSPARAARHYHGRHQRLQKNPG
jgi:hypothetical protein